jgi:hypothetical protein
MGLVDVVLWCQDAGVRPTLPHVEAIGTWPPVHQLQKLTVTICGQSMDDSLGMLEEIASMYPTVYPTDPHCGSTLEPQCGSDKRQGAGTTRTVFGYTLTCTSACMKSSYTPACMKCSQHGTAPQHQHGTRTKSKPTLHSQTNSPLPNMCVKPV